MADRAFILLKDGHEIAQHSTRLACVVEAIERKLAVSCRRDGCLIDGVRIEEEAPDGLR